MPTHFLAMVSTPEGGTKMVRCSSSDMGEAIRNTMDRESEDTVLFGLLDRDELENLTKELQSFELPPPGLQRFLVLFYGRGTLYSRPVNARHRERAIELAAYQNEQEEVSFSHVVGAFTLITLKELCDKVLRV